MCVLKRKNEALLNNPNISSLYSPVNCVSFHPEGQLIVSGSWDSTLKIWDVFHKTKKAVSMIVHNSLRFHIV